jgi:hypothetical protein
MNKKLLLAVLLSVFLLKASAQQDPTNYTKPDIIPPSPTAAALSRYGNVPVTMYTGMANVGIPIFTVQGTDISLPISLSYNYNGLKPAEQVSWVGLGWSLQAGGVITHSVHGKDDEYNTGNAYAYENSAAKYTNAYVTDDNTYLTDVMNRTYDAEPDVYSFNFAGHSGKFARVKNRYVLFPLQKLKIADNGMGFNITTEDGTIYSFTESETTQTKSSSGTGFIPSFTSAWYLTSVTNAAQTEKITLTYTDEGKLSQPGAWSQTLVKKLGFTPGYGTLSPLQLTMPTWVQSKRLASIQSSKYNVQFITEPSARQDITAFSTNGIYALSGISINSNGGTFVKSFRLNHTYFNAGSSYIGDKYLKLLSVSEISAVAPESPQLDSLTHNFDYYEEGGLPTRFSSGGVDHYNYYNGSTTTTLMPSTIYPGGAAREPIFGNAVLGSLTKVTYPTGGNTQFEYENNLMNTGDYVREPKGADLQLYRGDTTTVNEMTDTVSFNINEIQWVHILWQRTGKWTDRTSPNGDLKENISPELTLFNDELDPIYIGKILNTSENGEHSDSLQLIPGHYILQMICDKSENRVEGGVSYKFKTDILATRPGPGVRVKTITDNPVIGPPVVKKYKYEFGGGAVPNYMTSSYTERIHDVPGSPFITNDYDYFTYNSTLAQSEAPGLPYFYSKVTEDTGSDTINVSRSVYYFACLEQGGNNLGVEPAEELHYKKNSSGYSLLSSKFYGYDVHTDTLLFGVKPYVTIAVMEGPGGSAINTYSADVYPIFSEWKSLTGTTETIYNNDTLTTKTSNQYNLATRNLALTQQTGSDGKVITQKMKYPEDYTGTITGNLVAANVVAPVIEKQIWQKRSATDSILIGGTVTKYDSLLYKPVKVYALETTAGLSAPNSETKTSGKYNTLLSDNNYKQRVTYYYNTDAKITAQQLTNGITVAYQYGYPAAYGTEAGKNVYPIAECRNAAVVEFYTQNFEDNTSSASGAAHTGNRYYNGTSYTVSWTRPNSRAYVISYWYKSGGSWKYSGEVAYTGSSYTLSGGTAYDDIRIYPADAQMSTYTYLPGTGVSSTIDAKGITSYYEYDMKNRLQAIKDQYGNILKYNNYNYAH